MAMLSRLIGCSFAALLCGVAIGADRDLDQVVARGGVAATADAWPLFRGDAACTGVAVSTLPADLQELWTYRVPRGAFDATAVIVDGVVYVGDFDGVFYALRLSDGSPVWQPRKMSLGFAAAAAVRDGRIFVGDIDGKVFCLDAATGEELWTVETAGEINGGCNFFGNAVLVGSQDGNLYSLAVKDGEELWKYNINNMIQCSPALADGKVFLAGCDGVLHVVDAANGAQIGATTIEAETKSTPAVSGDVAYFGTYRETVVAVNWRAGELLWSYQTPQRRMPFNSSPAIYDDLVLIGGGDKQLHAIDAASGAARWTHRVRGKVDSSPVVVGDRVFFGASDGVLRAVSLKSQEETWTYEAGGGFTASCAVANERMVVGSTDGVVYCFGAK